MYCCWIIQELAERKRQGEWGVCTLSPGETGAKAGASLEEWVTAAKSLETPAEDKRRKTTARNPYCLSLLYLSPIRDTVNSTLLNAAASIHHKPFIITCHNITTSLSLHKRRCIGRLIMRVSNLNQQSRKKLGERMCACVSESRIHSTLKLCVCSQLKRVRRTELAGLYDEYGSIVQPCLPPQGTICSLSMHHLLVWAVSGATRGMGGGIRRGYGLWREGPSLGTDWRLTVGGVGTDGREVGGWMTPSAGGNSVTAVILLKTCTVKHNTQQKSAFSKSHILFQQILPRFTCSTARCFFHNFRT